MSSLKAELRKRMESQPLSKTESVPENIPNLIQLLEEIEISDEEDLLIHKQIEQREPPSLVDTLNEAIDTEPLSANETEMTDKEVQAKFDEIAAKLEGVF